MKSVLLINPYTQNKYFQPKRSLSDRFLELFFNLTSDRHFKIALGNNCTTMPPVTLYALAALFGDRCKLRVIDEQVDPIDYTCDPDLVCITSTTPQIARAFEISERFRGLGIKTAIGGVHASCLPDECAKRCDVVCIGEAEMYIDRLVDDLNHNRLSNRYQSKVFAPMEAVPFCDYDIGGGNYLPFYVITFSRGCVFHCEFCSINSTAGTFRTRPVQAVIEKIRAVGARYVWFPDATLTANPRLARELFKALIPLGVKWVGQITMNVAGNDEILDLMAESGCMLVSVGFESLNDSNIKASHKMQNRTVNYVQFIKKLHSRDIAIEGNFVFGFDEDDVDVFEKTAYFIVENGIDLPELYMLTPYPDTELYARLSREGRIVDFEWSHYDNTHFIHLPVFEPRNMSRGALRDGCREAEKIIYSRINSLKRIRRSGVFHVPVLAANWIYASRMAAKGSLVPSATPT